MLWRGARPRAVTRHGGGLRLAGVGGRAMASKGGQSISYRRPRDRWRKRQSGAVYHGSCGHIREAADAAVAARPTRSSSSTVPISPTGSRGGCGGPRHRSRSSITCRRRCGRGVPGGRAPCAPMSIACSRSCRSSRRCTAPRRTALRYVGHPLVERIAELRPDAEDVARGKADPPVVLVLPGSRSSEVRRLLAIFGDAIER